MGRAGRGGAGRGRMTLVVGPCRFVPGGVKKTPVAPKPAGPTVAEISRIRVRYLIRVGTRDR